MKNATKRNLNEAFNNKQILQSNPKPKRKKIINDIFDILNFNSMDEYQYADRLIEKIEKFKNLFQQQILNLQNETITNEYHRVIKKYYNKLTGPKSGKLFIDEYINLDQKLIKHFKIIYQQIQFE